MVWPAISRRILRGRRVEAMRAGMMATTFMTGKKAADYSRTRRMSAGKHLALQQVDRLADIGHAEMLGRRRIALGNFFVHRVSDVAIGKMPGWCGAQLADVKRFGEIHLEERPAAITHGQHVERIVDGALGRARSQLGRGFSGSLHDLLVTR